MKKIFIALLFCAAVVQTSAEKTKPFVEHPMYATQSQAAKYPLTFTILSAYTVTATDQCWINVSDGDGRVYQLSHGPCNFPFKSGDQFRGAFHHWPMAGTDVRLLLYIPKKHKYDWRAWTVVGVATE